MEILDIISKLTLTILSMFSALIVIFVVYIFFQTFIIKHKLKKRAQVYLTLILIINEGREEDKEKLSKIETLEIPSLSENSFFNFEIIKKMKETNMSFMIPYFKRVVNERLIKKTDKNENNN